MKSVEFSCLMWDRVSGSLASGFDAVLIEEIVNGVLAASTPPLDKTDVRNTLRDEGVDGVIGLLQLDTDANSVDGKKRATLMKSVAGKVIERCRGPIYQKCTSLSRLSIGSEAELKKLADEYLSDFDTRITNGSRSVEDIVPVCEVIGKSELVREVARRSEALSAILREPSLDGIMGNHYGEVFKSVRMLMASACDPLIVDGEFHKELATDSSTDVYVVKLRESIFRSWEPQKNLLTVFQRWSMCGLVREKVTLVGSGSW